MKITKLFLMSFPQKSPFAKCINDFQTKPHAAVILKFWQDRWSVYKHVGDFGDHFFLDHKQTIYIFQVDYAGRAILCGSVLFPAICVGLAAVR